MKLDKLQSTNKNENQSVDGFNKESYMSDLNAIRIKSDTEIYDLKKARALLKSVTLANPDSQSGWIAAARVEELDGKTDEASKILARACVKFPRDEDIWLEAARLSSTDKAK